MNKRTLYILLLEVIFIAIVLWLSYNVVRFQEASELAHIPGWVPLITLIIGINIYFLILHAVTFRRTLLKFMQNPSAIWNAEPADFPQLDKQTFDRYDAQLISLGFEPRFYYAISSSLSTDVKGLARLYYHVVHRFYAINSQMFQNNMITPMVCINTEMDDDWLLSTVSVKPDATSCIWRRPRALWNVIPAGELSVLLYEHLQVRQHIVDGLGVGIVTDDRDQSAFFDILARLHWQRLEQLRKKNVILLYIEYLYYGRKPISTWTGDLDKAVRNHQGL